MAVPAPEAAGGVAIRFVGGTRSSMSGLLVDVQGGENTLGGASQAIDRRSGAGYAIMAANAAAVGKLWTKNPARRIVVLRRDVRAGPARSSKCPGSPARGSVSAGADWPQSVVHLCADPVERCERSANHHVRDTSSWEGTRSTRSGHRLAICARGTTVDIRWMTPCDGITEEHPGAGVRSEVATRQLLARRRVARTAADVGDDRLRNEIAGARDADAAHRRTTGQPHGARWYRAGGHRDRCRPHPPSGCRGRGR